MTRAELDAMVARMAAECERLKRDAEAAVLLEREVRAEVRKRRAMSGGEA